ncbi:MAG: PfkB family carbohydrate kinase [Roseiflexaceae bacterium]|nr:PfkB family carbohydrate kinase [Roseiflexaceae bacterium]
MNLVAVGECTIDHYLDLNIEAVGGISLNYAVNARRCGAARVGLVTCTGADSGAALVRAKLAREQIEAQHVHTLPGSTGTQAITMAAGGERIFPPGGYNPGVLAEFRLTQADLAYIREFDIVAVPYFRQIAHLFRAAILDPQSHAWHVADLLDAADCGPALINIRELLIHLDLAFVSGGREMVEQIRQSSIATPTLIVVTHGPHGSSAIVGEEIYFQPALPVALAVDTTGCGDAFQAAFTIEYFRSRNIRAALADGATQAAVVIGHYGATGIA